MPTTVVDEPVQLVLVFMHKSPWCWWRLRELHLVATGQHPSKLQVLDPRLEDKYAKRAYENALYTLLAMQSFLNHQNLDAMMNDLADFAESVGAEGLEAPLLSGLFGLDAPDLRKKGRTTTVQRLARILQRPLTTPMAGGLDIFPVVDRSASRIRFYGTGAVSDTLQNLNFWLGRVDGGMGGVGGFGYQMAGPLLGSFISRTAQLSAGTTAPSQGCAAFGAAVSGAIQAVISAEFALLGAFVGTLVEPVGGTVIGGIVGGVAGAAAGAAYDKYFGWGEIATQTCDAVFAPGANEPNPGSGDPSKKMPNPLTEETGLTPTEIQYATAAAKLNSAKQPLPDTEVMQISGEPVVIRTKQALVTDPAENPVVNSISGTPKVVPTPRPRGPGGPLFLQSVGTLAPERASVAVASDDIDMSFIRVGDGEYVLQGNLPKWMF